MKSLDLTRLDGSRFDTAFLDDKVVLVVNVASYCGYTPQYEGLQALWSEHRGDGLVVVGVPCNQFGAQEPGSSEQIAEFCRINYGVDFPLLEKQDVNGPDRSRLYRWLIGSEPGGGADVAWNFEKFLVGRDGEVIARFPSRVGPDDSRLAQALSAALER